MINNDMLQSAHKQTDKGNLTVQSEVAFYQVPVYHLPLSCSPAPARSRILALALRTFPRHTPPRRVPLNGQPWPAREAAAS